MISYTLLFVVALSAVLTIVSGQDCVLGLNEFKKCTNGIDSLSAQTAGEEGIKERCLHIDTILDCYKTFHKSCYSNAEVTDYCAEKAVWKGICGNIDVYLEGIKCMGELYMQQVYYHCSKQNEISRVLTSPMTEDAWHMACELSIESVACNYGYIAVSNCSIHFRELARKTNFASLHRNCKQRHYVCSSLVDSHCTEDDVFGPGVPTSSGITLQYCGFAILVSYIFMAVANYITRRELFH